LAEQEVYQICSFESWYYWVKTIQMGWNNCMEFMAYQSC